ncbi:hypothetical protein K438DRAFT_1946317 [Mycena galopus ATCC 62051]|nr:hypothetical protein K438DRAFT_1946317 [Mycena galopus ATCC 62051]
MWVADVGLNINRNAESFEWRHATSSCSSALGERIMKTYCGHEWVGHRTKAEHDGSLDSSGFGDVAAHFGGAPGIRGVRQELAPSGGVRLPHVLRTSAVICVGLEMRGGAREQNSLDPGRWELQAAGEVPCIKGSRRAERQWRRCIVRGSHKHCSWLGHLRSTARIKSDTESPAAVSLQLAVTPPTTDRRWGSVPAHTGIAWQQDQAGLLQYRRCVVASRGCQNLSGVTRRTAGRRFSIHEMPSGS